MSWNKEGIQGLPGVPGAPGAPGATGKEGAQGKQGVRGPEGEEGLPGATFVSVRFAQKSVPAKTVGEVTASCLPGEKATGGGNSVSGSDIGWTVSESGPLPNEEGSTPTKWEVRALNETGATATLVTYVICAFP